MLIVYSDCLSPTQHKLELQGLLLLVEGFKYCWGPQKRSPLQEAFIGESQVQIYFHNNTKISKMSSAFCHSFSSKCPEGNFRRNCLCNSTPDWIRDFQKEPAFETACLIGSEISRQNPLLCSTLDWIQKQT